MSLVCVLLAVFCVLAGCGDSYKNITTSSQNKASSTAATSPSSMSTSFQSQSDASANTLIDIQDLFQRFGEDVSVAEGLPACEYDLVTCWIAVESYLADEKYTEYIVEGQRGPTDL
jgi:uncharacterized protein YceK